MFTPGSGRVMCSHPKNAWERDVFTPGSGRVICSHPKNGRVICSHPKWSGPLDRERPASAGIGGPLMRTPRTAGPMPKPQTWLVLTSGRIQLINAHGVGRKGQICGTRMPAAILEYVRGEPAG